MLPALCYDLTHSYDLTFYLGGGCILLAGALLLTAPFVRRCKTRHGARSTNVFNTTRIIIADGEAEVRLETPQKANDAQTDPVSTLLVQDTYHQNGTVGVAV